jgi:zinc protease
MNPRSHSISARLLATPLIVVALLASSPALGAMSLPPTREMVLPNGAKLILAEKHDVPLISFAAYVRGGSITDPPGKEGLASLTAEMLRKGAGKRSAQEIASTTDGAGAVLSTGANVELSWVVGEFLARDEGLMIELLSDLLRRPSFPDSEFVKLKQQWIDALRSEKDNPNNLLTEYGRAYFMSDHPYGRPLDGDEATVATITRDDVIACYRANFGGDRLILSVVGDFDSKRMEAALRSAVGGWARAPGALAGVPEPRRLEGRRVLLLDKPDATQTYFWIGNLGISRTDPDRNAVDAANTYFGGRFTSMLSTALRIRSGLTYHIGCNVIRYARPGPIEIPAYTKTESTQRAIDLTIETLKTFRNSGLDSTALSSVKSYLAGLYPTSFETSDQIAARLAELALYNLPHEELTGYVDRIRKLDGGKLTSIIRRAYPDPKDLTLVLIGNAAAIRATAKRYGPVVEARFDQPLLSAVRSASPRAR